MNILHIDCISEQWRYVLWHKACYATADGGNEESLLRVRLGVSDELVDVWLDSFDTALHCRDGVALPLWTIAIAHDCTEVETGCTCSSASMHACKVAAEDEDFVWFER